MSGRSGVSLIVQQLPRISKTLTVVLATLIVAQVAGTVLLPLATGRLVAALTGNTSEAMRGVVVGLVLLGLVLLLDVVLAPIRAMVTARLSAAVDLSMAQRTVEGALRPAQINHLDNADMVDRIEQARAVGVGAFPPGQAVTALSHLVPLRLTGLAACVLLGWAGHWWMPAVLGAAWVITGRWQEQEIERAVAAQAGETDQLRRAAYLRNLAVTAPPAKEVRLFGLQSWLVERFSTAWWDGMAQIRQATTSWQKHFAAIVLLLAAHAAVLVPLAYETANGALSVELLAVALQAVLAVDSLGFSGDLNWLLRTASAAVPAALAVDALEGESRPAIAAPTDLPQREIRLENVRFTYPGDRPPVLDGVNLVIAAGSSLAIVGDNGAGKSTITKLLAGLYKPDGGRITIDGSPMDDYELASWRRQLAVVFQDFVRYPFSVRDNIGFGYVEADATDDGIAMAAELGGFLGVEEELGDGWDTPLSGAYAGGTDLSGGQWQRLALSRALYAVRHGARVLVLDEPTAHLDIQAEHDLYSRFLEMTAGLTTILVSHRFATVRLADRIAVVRDGQISEYGTHDELLAAGGRYAHMFRVQSEPFEVSGGNGRA